MSAFGGNSGRGLGNAKCPLLCRVSDAGDDRRSHVHVGRRPKAAKERTRGRRRRSLELIGCKGHELVSCAAVGAIVLVPEGDAVLRGERKDGTKLKPPMALQRYATMTDDDLNDLIAYLRTATMPAAILARGPSRVPNAAAQTRNSLWWPVRPG